MVNITPHLRSVNRLSCIYLPKELLPTDWSRMRIKKNTLITGTIILTVTGLASRLIGFFYRIFLSRLFGEENMGIYQLIGCLLYTSDAADD